MRWIAERFELLRLLGQGASGSVHAAHDHRDQRLVALKLLHSSPGDTAETAGDAEARLRAGAALASRLDHPDIVKVYDVGSDRGSPWLAMEAVPGPDLTRYTLPQRLLPEPLVLQVGERLALALAHAHGLGVIHRDLKPANVLAHWPSQTLKIVDFGLARGQDVEATRTGLVLGTPGYMAPEQLAGAVPDERSDFYALGVLMFQLLTGRLPFEAGNLGELLRRVANDPAPDLRSLRPQLPGALAESLASLLQRQPGQRCHDAAALAAQWQALRSTWPGGAKSR
jgi:serine/threonine-protein kinase